MYPAEVDMLFRLNVFWKVLNGRKIILNEALPYPLDTRFGWVVGISVVMDERHSKITHGPVVEQMRI